MCTKTYNLTASTEFWSFSLINLSKAMASFSKCFSAIRFLFFSMTMSFSNCLIVSSFTDREYCRGRQKAVVNYNITYCYIHLPILSSHSSLPRKTVVLYRFYLNHKHFFLFCQVVPHTFPFLTTTW